MSKAEIELQALRQEVDFLRDIALQKSPYYQLQASVMLHMLRQPPDFVVEDRNAAAVIQAAVDIPQSEAWQQCIKNLCYEAGVLRMHRIRYARYTNAFSLDFTRLADAQQEPRRTFMTPAVVNMMLEAAELGRVSGHLDLERPHLIEAYPLVRPEPTDIEAVRFGVTTEGLARLGLSAIQPPAEA
jgi:hypothetical protein